MSAGIKYPYRETLSTASYDYEIWGEGPGDWSLVKLLDDRHDDMQNVVDFKTRAAARKFFYSKMCHECGRSDLD